MEAEAAAAAKEEKAHAKAEAKAAEEAEAARLVAAFELCEHGCVRGGAVPDGQVEAVPCLWAQEQPMQGQGLCGRAQAPAAGLQRPVGRAVGAGGGGAFL